MLDLIESHRIDLVVPCFEDVFYLARHLDELSMRTELFTSPFDLLARLHHKASFNALARSLGIGAPDTTVVRSHEELVAAIRGWPRWFARPVFSRGGIDLATNAGPLAGAIDLARIRPTPRWPWIVQEYVEGIDLCTSTIAVRGKVAAHCAYVHPLEIEHAGGIVFESIDEPEALACTERLVEATGYHGALGIDFRRGPRGLIALECNPRPTAGVHLMSDEQLVDAVLAQPGDVARPWVVPPGARRMYASALVRDGLRHRERLRTDLGYLFSDARDIYSEPGDRLPAFVQLLAFLQVAGYRRRHPRPARARTTLVAAWLDGLVWNGDAIP